MFCPSAFLVLEPSISDAYVSYLTQLRSFVWSARYLVSDGWFALPRANSPIRAILDLRVRKTPWEGTWFPILRCVLLGTNVVSCPRHGGRLETSVGDSLPTRTLLELPGSPCSGLEANEEQRKRLLIFCLLYGSLTAGLHESLGWKELGFPPSSSLFLCNALSSLPLPQGNLPTPRSFPVGISPFCLMMLTC